MFHILVVEDDTNTRKLTCDVLSDNGYTPIEARDGIEALEIMDEKHVDLIIMDVMMPRMDGLELCETIRKASYPDKIFTRRQLMDELWDMTSDTDERTVDVHINRIREHLKNNHDFEILTVRGLGYKAVKLKG